MQTVLCQKVHENLTIIIINGTTININWPNLTLVDQTYACGSTKTYE
jgi:hypothetical protein